jgi:GDP-4-dehydro-6-deoxy-D-mannose reductase
VRIFVTGADGFVGRRLVAALLTQGHEVIAACRPGGAEPAVWLGSDASSVRVVPLELAGGAPLDLGAAMLDAVVHLAAVSSGAEARSDPLAAWEINVLGTVRLLDVLAARSRATNERARVLLVSSGEVYGSGPARPRLETDAVEPVAPYGATKAAAELAGLEYRRRTGLDVLIARAFPHTGPGQSTRFVVPGFVDRLRRARREGRRTVPTGNLEPVRDLLDVRDVVRAYLALLEHGVPGEIYNVASGSGVSIRELFDRLASLLGIEAVPETDPSLVRAADIPHLVGDRSKLERATRWRPTITLDETLRGIVDAEAD